MDFLLEAFGETYEAFIDTGGAAGRHPRGSPVPADHVRDEWGGRDADRGAPPTGAARPARAAQWSVSTRRQSRKWRLRCDQLLLRSQRLVLPRHPGLLRQLRGARVRGGSTPGRCGSRSRTGPVTTTCAWASLGDDSVGGGRDEVAGPMRQMNYGSGVGFGAARCARRWRSCGARSGPTAAAPMRRRCGTWPG